jgi:deoxyribodipyrimidine photo-lyase
MARCEIGVDYPLPIVDHSKALRDAKERLFAIRKSATGRREARRVYLAHGSRKGNRHRAVEDRNGAAGV